MSRRRSRARVAIVALGALILISLLIWHPSDVSSSRSATTPGSPSATSGGHPIPLLDNPVTGFGGYRETGPVTQVQASWAVPKIIGGPPGASASTWIGVQDAAGDFIQIGTTENGSVAAGYYNVFWSDTTVGFHPHFLLSVRPGQVITARLFRTPRGWTGGVEDATLNASVAIPSGVRYAPTARMEQSEWTQEDPVIAGTDMDEPYPEMTPTTFTGLQVDDTAPHLLFNDATALASPNGLVLVPGAFHDDGFTLLSGSPSQSHYLLDVSAFDLALNRFATPRVVGGGQTAANGRALISGLAAFDGALASQQWPPSARPAIAALQAHNLRLLAAVKAWVSAGESRPYLTAIQEQAGLDGRFSDAVRTALGLPPVD